MIRGGVAAGKLIKSGSLVLGGKQRLEFMLSVTPFYVHNMFILSSYYHATHTHLVKYFMIRTDPNSASKQVAAACCYFAVSFDSDNIMFQ